MGKIYTTLTLLLLVFFFNGISQSTNERSKESELPKVILQQLSKQESSADFKLSLLSKKYFISSNFTSRGRTYINLYQTHNDLLIDNANGVIALKDNQIIHIQESFASLNQLEKISTINPSLSAIEAVNILKKRFSLNGEVGSTSSTLSTANKKTTFNTGSLGSRPIVAELVYFNHKNKVRLTWKVKLPAANRVDIYVANIDAITGEIYLANNKTTSCSIDHANQLSQVNSHLEKNKTSPTLHYHQKEKQTLLDDMFLQDASYRVFAYPLESPFFGDRTLVSNPWELAGSNNPATTLGWHDDGTNIYNSTDGNNVYVYENRDADGLPGASPTGDNFVFDFPYDFPQSPEIYENASMTNLFYWNNIAHDITYQYGFDEPSGNFQTNNFERGGNDSDKVIALAQDGFTRNNAQFSTSPDGEDSFMFMYIFDVQSTITFTVNSPSHLAKNYQTRESNFSVNNKLEDIGSISGQLILANDGVEPTTDACETPFLNDVAGKVVLINRGGCSFAAKALAAENAGAIAVIVANDVPNQVLGLGGRDDSVTIPTFGITQEDGQILQEALIAGESINLDLSASGSFETDSSMANGIIVHEYGHGVNDRLTGGPNSICLDNEEQMGEGWSDFQTLMINTDWSTANGETPRGIGNFVTNQEPGLSGIRTLPYSTDMSINPVTYASVIDSPRDRDFPSFASSPHFHGSVWASMLWDMTWNIIEEVPASPDIYNGEGGNNIAFNLVMEGLKLQGCSPGFTTGRDAILKADEILYDGRFKCIIWESFANRGLGASADQGSVNDIYDAVEAFDLPSSYTFVKKSEESLIREGEEVNYSLEIRTSCKVEENVTVEDTLPDSFEFVTTDEPHTIDGNVITFGPYDFGTSTFKVINYSVKVKDVVNSLVETLFSDDGETDNNFELSRNLPDNNENPEFNWQISDENPFNGNSSWLAPNISEESDIIMTTPSFNLVGFENPVLTFNHSMAEIGFVLFNGNIDGGVVEISIDGGETWEDLGDNFTQNGYNDITEAFAFFINPLGIREVFTDNFPYMQTIADLSDYVGFPEVKVRFRLGLVGLNASGGWYVDGVSIFEGEPETAINLAEVIIDEEIKNQSQHTVELICRPTINLPEEPGTYTANTFCADDLGWTHYIDNRGTLEKNDDVLLLSINNKGQNLGNISYNSLLVSLTIEEEYNAGTAINLSNANYVADQGYNKWFAANKWWSISSTAVDTFNEAITVRSYYTPEDLADISSSLGISIDENFLSVYVADETNLEPTLANHQDLVIDENILSLPKQTVSVSTWNYLNEAQFALGNDVIVTEFAITDFASGGIGAYEGIPDFEIANFAVNSAYCVANVSWSTVMEGGCAQMELQRSEDGQNFVTIASFNCTGTPKDYNYTDDHNFDSKTYSYRIKTNGSNGQSFDFTETLTTEMDCDNVEEFIIYPNPISSNETLIFERPKNTSPVNQIVLMDAKGRIFEVREIEDNFFRRQYFDITNLASGVYFIKVYYKDGADRSVSFTVNNLN